MGAADDAEVMRVAEQLERATSLLSSTATALVAPLLGMLAWLVFLRPSGAAAAFFTEGASPAPAEAVRAPLPQSTAHRPSVSARREPRAEVQNATRPAPTPRAPARRAPLALAALGAFMLLFGAADALRTRASYVSSQPAAGATLAAAPAAVRVSFGAALDPASSLSITRLVLPPYTGEQPQEIEISRRLAPDDPTQPNARSRAVFAAGRGVSRALAGAARTRRRAPLRLVLLRRRRARARGHGGADLLPARPRRRCARSPPHLRGRRAAARSGRTGATLPPPQLADPRALPAVHRQHHAGDEARLVGGEEDGRPRHVPGACPSCAPSGTEAWRWRDQLCPSGCRRRARCPSIAIGVSIRPGMITLARIAVLGVAERERLGVGVDAGLRGLVGDGGRRSTRRRSRRRS